MRRGGGAQGEREGSELGENTFAEGEGAHGADVKDEKQKERGVPNNVGEKVERLIWALKEKTRRKKPLRGRVGNKK